MSVPHIVVVGAGFGGLHAVRALAHLPVRITIIDRRNHHLFQPLLYQVATAGLSAPDVGYPIRKLFHGLPNVTTWMAEVTKIDRATRTVTLHDGVTVTYDHLVLALGMVTNHFGRQDWARATIGLKTLDEALEIRRRVINAFEFAERTDDAEARRAMLTFVVVGAGPTGVELAGALAEIARKTLMGDFRRVDPAQARVVLVDAADRVLPAFHPDLSKRAWHDLDAMGVRVEVGRKVVNVDARGIQIGDEFIPAATVLWAAGVKAPDLTKTLGFETDRAGRVKVGPDLSPAEDPAVSVIGDIAWFEQDGAPIPGVAPVAIAQGKHLGKVVAARLAGKEAPPFVHKDKGALATIGRARAVAQVGKLHLTGRVAWWTWLLVHIMSLIGFHNRLSVMLSWAWAYVSWNRSARVVLQAPLGRPDAPPPPQPVSPPSA
jgi:NADH dehydrogenase